MLQQKKISPLDSTKHKNSKVAKTLLIHILQTKLKIDNETMSKMLYKEIFKNDKGDLIVQFNNVNHVGYIYSQINNIEHDDTISINEYIPAEFYKRHRQLNVIAKVMRINNLNTHLIHG